MRLNAPRSAVLLLVALLSAAAGCSFDASVNAKHGCSNTCTVCMLGFCLSEGKGGVDAGGHGGNTAQGSGSSDGGTPGGSSGGGDAGAQDGGTDAAAVPEPCTKGDFCFDGPGGAATVGQCKAGMKHCENGFYGPCLGQVTPVDEQCNDQDDDCDGKVDEDVAGASCTADTVQGACKAGTLTCDKGVPRCQPMADPVAESCNGVDDDCDGNIDEDTSVACYPPDETGCLAPSSPSGSWTCTGACKAGAQACSGGQLGSCEGAVTPASTDGCTASGTAADDDCDGMIDEDCPCTNGAMQSCYSGPAATLGVGTCASGTQTCSGNTFGGCVGSVTPVDETCQNQGADNDCDGMRDNVPHLGEPCTDTNKKGVCRTGTLQCEGTSSASLTCVTPAPATEVCDGLDNNCDGNTDEGFDTKSDPANCGACGTMCPGGQTCCNSACRDTTRDASYCGMCTVSCGSGFGCCSGGCQNLQTDGNNCGSCGHKCAGTETCCGRQCVDLQADDDNDCGACGHRCSTGLSCCSGTCVDLQKSNTNCGKCGTNCGLTGGTLCNCQGGTCGGVCL